MNKGNLIKMKLGGHEGRALNAACGSQQEERGFPPDSATTSCPQLEANKKITIALPSLLLKPHKSCPFLCLPGLAYDSP